MCLKCTVLSVTSILNVDLHMTQALLVVATSSHIYTFPSILFHKYGGTNVPVTNFISHVYMLVPTKSDVKLAKVNMRIVQVIEIILMLFS